MSEDDNTVRVQVKKVYGQWVYYPMCENARTFARIAGTSTLTPSTMTDVNKLGFRVYVDQEKPTMPFLNV